MVPVPYSHRGKRLMRRVWDDMTLLGRVTTMVCIPILLLLATVWVGDQTRHEPTSTAGGEDPAAWADRLEAEYLDMVGRDSWPDHCQQDKAEWACATNGMDAPNLGLLQVQMNGEYDDPTRRIWRAGASTPCSPRWRSMSPRGAHGLGDRRRPPGCSHQAEELPLPLRPLAQREAGVRPVTSTRTPQKVPRS
jgi:hypothetical protein